MSLDVQGLDDDTVGFSRILSLLEPDFNIYVEFCEEKSNRFLKEFKNLQPVLITYRSQYVRSTRTSNCNCTLFMH